MTALLTVRELERTLGNHGFTLDVASLDLAAGDRVAVVGPSGSGKSTLLGLLALALAPDRSARFVVWPPGSGPIDIAALWHQRRREALARLRARLIGFVPQTGGLLPFLSIAANIALPLSILGTDGGVAAAALAAALGIGHLLARRPHEISVGERQRAAVARALIAGPALLLADEPTAALHPSQAEAAMSLLVIAAAETRAALLVATHDEPLAHAAGLSIVRLVPDAGGEARSHLAWKGA
ncbi:MAG: ATP-binding cassette domain-containing protein [Acetobacteraceae bacterium]